MPILRTPDDRFGDLPDYPFEPNYAQVPIGLGDGDGDTNGDGDNSNANGGTLRVHYLDEGPADAAPVPAPARRAFVELPLPPHDPVAGGGPGIG